MCKKVQMVLQFKKIKKNKQYNTKTVVFNYFFLTGGNFFLNIK